jgi:hypothetical protein
MASRRLPDQTDATGRDLAISIADDFRGLVRLFTALIEREVAEGEVLAHILDAKFAAERGLFLIERFADLSAEGGPTGHRETH